MGARAFADRNEELVVVVERHQPEIREAARRVASQIPEPIVAAAELIARHVMVAEWLHGDDTTVPILAKGRTTTGRIWAYVRDDRPFGEPDPPAALFYASRDRAGAHPEIHLSGFAGFLQADAYGGYTRIADHPAHRLDELLP